MKKKNIWIIVFIVIVLTLIITLFTSCNKDKDDSSIITRCYTCTKNYTIELKGFNHNHATYYLVTGYPKSSSSQDYVCNMTVDDKKKYEQTYTFDKTTYDNSGVIHYQIHEIQTCGCK